MQRLSQVSSHLLQGESTAVTRTRRISTPLQADRGDPANTNNTMAKTKIVVTRKPIEKAQELLDTKKDDLDIVRWQSEKVRHFNLRGPARLADIVAAAMRPGLVTRKRQGGDWNPCDAIRQGR